MPRSGRVKDIYTMLWLHVKRTERYIWDLIAWGITDFLWLTIYLLGALVFMDPADYPVLLPQVFWAMIAWGLISGPVWTIGNWMRFYINMGIYEEHELVGVDHNLFLSLRAIPTVVESLVIGVVAALFLTYITGYPALRADIPLLLAASLTAILLIAVLYGLILAYLSLYTSVPAPLLDLVSFLLFIVGGVAVPINRLPGVLQPIAIVIPYSHPSEIMRYAVNRAEPYLGLVGETIVTLVYIGILLFTVHVLSRKARRKARLHGVKGIGRT